jgi:hypothetical protein
MFQTSSEDSKLLDTTLREALNSKLQFILVHVVAILSGIVALQRFGRGEGGLDTAVQYNEYILLVLHRFCMPRRNWRIN